MRYNKKEWTSGSNLMKWCVEIFWSHNWNPSYLVTLNICDTSNWLDFLIFLWAFCFIICIMGQLMQRLWKFHKKVYGLWRHLFNILQCHHTQYGSENHSTIKYEPRTRLEQWNNVQLKSQRENNYDSKSVLVYALHLRLSWIW